MKSSPRIWFIFLCCLFIISGIGGLHSQSPALLMEMEPTVFLARHDGKLRQMVRLGWPKGLAREITLSARIDDETVKSKMSLGEEEQLIHAFIPVCEQGNCRLEIEARDSKGFLVAQGEFKVRPPRKWNVYIAPFSHIDIGFTQTQSNVLAKNIDNLRAALGLIQQTREYPGEARFKFFTEVSWPLYNFLYTDMSTPEEKAEMLEALEGGAVEPGGFYISHQDRFMPKEAMFRSVDFALRINREFGTPVRTACLHDLADLSHVVKPLHAAGVKYFMAGPNDSRYVVPPLFYLKPPVGNEQVLAWHTPGLNGYGENFDLAMRPEFPISDEAMAEMERRLGGHLKELESGFPTDTLLAHYDYFGAHWEYPYDIYFLPFYPAHEVDNGPQDLTPCEIVRLWNQQWAFPRLRIVTPAEFFEEVEARYSDQIPVIRGEMPGFWGEQVLFDLIQVDPNKESLQRKFEQNATLAEMLASKRFLLGIPVPEIRGLIQEGYSRIILNNDHNPCPVPFGHTDYTKEDIREWKLTRRRWISEADEIETEALRLATDDGIQHHQKGPGSPINEESRVEETEGEFILENEFYRILVDKDTGSITSLVDKSLEKDLVASADGYLFNQYVMLSRGEAVGLRNYIKHQPGFKRVNVEVIEAGPERAAVRVSGDSQTFRGEGRVVSRFAKEKFGIPIPGWLIKGIASSIFKLGRGEPLRVGQEISLAAGKRRVEFIQQFSGEKKQMKDHAFAYTFNIPDTQQVYYDGAYELLSFTPGPPLGGGDLIPSAKFIKEFPSINFSTAPFHWIYGIPPSITFRNYAMLLGEGFAVAFSSPDSGAILPGPLHHDPVRGPFGGGFYHICLGWTAWGKIGLGLSSDSSAPDKEEYVFRSYLTSFAAEDVLDARQKAANFALESNRADFEQSCFYSDNPGIVITTAWPIPGEKALIMRLWETSGRSADARISLQTDKKIVNVMRARSDGEPLFGKELGHGERSFRIKMSSGEVATVRLEFE